MSLLNKIKNGKKNNKIVNFPNTDEKVALVILSSSELTDAKIKTDEYCKENGIEDDGFIDIQFQQQILYRALRDKDDLNKKLADSLDEIRQLQTDELAYLTLQYNQLQQDTSPFLNSINEEQFAELKKTFEKMNLSDLSGESLVVLRNFLMTLV